MSLTEQTSEIAAALESLGALLRGDDLDPWPQREADVARVEAARERLLARFTLAVVGEFSSGKSFLLNALLGAVHLGARGEVAGLLATDINPSTATITELEYAPAPTALASFPSGRSERVPIEGLSRFVAVGADAPGSLHDATADDDAAPSFVRIGIPSPFLERGFLVADTPGLASLNPSHRRATLAYLPRADAVLYLIDTQQPFTEGDAGFLGIVGEYVRTILIVQTKIDLWRGLESDGQQAWEHARRRIVARADALVPDASVFSVSARDFALGTLNDDPEAIARSGFPTFVAALERSLEERAHRARLLRAASVAREVVDRTSARLRREAALLEAEPADLRLRQERAEAAIAERERALAREKDAVERAETARIAWLEQRGEELVAELQRVLAAALDVADIERLRDRGRLHSLVDATAAPVLGRFAREVAADSARELERIAAARPALHVADVAATRFGGEPGTGAWSRDLTSGLEAAIVLGALGGPVVGFVQSVARAFAQHPPGKYMKRELGADLAATFWPALESALRGHAHELAERFAAVYEDLGVAIARERDDVRAETLDPIARALDAHRNAHASAAANARLRRALARLAEVEGRLRRHAPAETANGAHARAIAQATAVAFDADAYDRGLRPERYRVVVLGALRRGKSSLINAIAETRILHDDAGREATFPIHVRYGNAERAYALEDDGRWREIDAGSAVAQAARTPVLIEVPWKMPKQLVLVHAPAFDSGDAEAERIALAAAANASETLGLFSRQLSDRELDLYGRVAENGKPLLLAHTIADNETPAERREVVDLAARYLMGKAIPVRRIFTISALDYLEAVNAGRPAAAWNEMAALRETLRAHAEEHMQHLAERERRAQRPQARAAAPAGSKQNLRDALRRLLGN